MLNFIHISSICSKRLNFGNCCSTIRCNCLNFISAAPVIADGARKVADGAQKVGAQIGEAAVDGYNAAAPVVADGARKVADGAQKVGAQIKLVL